jgi:hypothetical protein
MNRTTIQIIQIPHSKKEIQSSNRNKTGYNVFLSWFFHDFNIMDEDEQKHLLCINNIHQYEEYQAHEEDSVISRPRATTIDIIRLAARVWGGMSESIKCAWRQRAEIVNSLPILGSFTEIPTNITNHHIIHSLTLEHNRFVTFIHNILKKTSGFNKDSMKTKKIGNERIKLGYQVFRSFFINHLLKLSFLGPNNCKLNDNEIVHRYKKSVVVHIASMKRVIDLFRMNGVCAFEFKKNDFLVSCSGRVSVRKRMQRTGQEGIGYILKDNSVLLETGQELMNIKLPIYNAGNGEWDYNRAGNDEYTITEYWPIRLRLNDSGNCQMTFNKVILNTDKTKVIPI